MEPTHPELTKSMIISSYMQYEVQNEVKKIKASVAIENRRSSTKGIK